MGPDAGDGRKHSPPLRTGGGAGGSARGGDGLVAIYRDSQDKLEYMVGPATQRIAHAFKRFRASPLLANALHSHALLMRFPLAC
jgi:hypothetical protein